MFHLFHHIPKSAGNACLVGFATMLNVVRDYHASTSPEDLRRFDDDRVDLARLGPGDVLCGHWNLRGRRLHQRYPALEAFGPRKITFIREPLAAAQSGVRYGVQQGWCRPGSEDAALVARVGYVHQMLECDETSYRAVLDGYWFVDVAEHLQQGFDQLTAMMGRAAVELPRVNTTDGIAIRFSDDAIAEFTARNRVDFLVHDYATTLHARRVAAATPAPG